MSFQRGRGTRPLALATHPRYNSNVFQSLGDRDNGCLGGELDSTGQSEVQVACRGWSAGHVKSRPKNLIAESNLAMAA
jgi:hypothetical protein